ncbi:MAG: DUF2202 domain-containing protein [Chloroflexi bacterium]|nr:DUF2202 domain-containing protein [Chloroflexota bacterium]
MKKNWVAWTSVLLVGVLLVAGLTVALKVNAQGRVDAPGRVQVAERDHTHVIDVTGAEPLTQDEIAGLLYMREEEKLARDVYLALAERWGQSVFATIAGSEAQHMEAVLDLLKAYGVDDPVQGRAAGEFANADLQALYGTLTEQGNISLLEAFRVGAAIEEFDIVDLRSHLAETEQAALVEVYTNLERASRNHLRAFVRQVERESGEAYVPRYLSADDYAAILATVGSGNGRNQGQAQGRGQRQGQMQARELGSCDEDCLEQGGLRGQRRGGLGR